MYKLFTALFIVALYVARCFLRSFSLILCYFYLALTLTPEKTINNNHTCNDCETFGDTIAK